MNIDILEVIKNDEKLKSIINDLAKDKSKTKDEAYKVVIDYLKSKDINATYEDIDILLKNNTKEIFKNKVSDAELDTISGGIGLADFDYQVCTDSQESCWFGSGFYAHSDPACSATVEYNSWCGSNDQCKIWSDTYDWYRNQ